MSVPSLRPTPKTPEGARGLRFLLGTSLLVGLCLVIYAGSRTLERPPACILLVDPRSPNLDTPQRDALATLIQDHLECLGGLPVAKAQEIPERTEMKGFPERTLILVPSLSRRDNALIVSFRYAWLAKFLRDPVGCWRESPALEGSPTPTLGRALKALPLVLSSAEAHHLLPVRDNLFWSLVQGQAWHRENSRLSEAQALGASVTDTEPECVSAWILRGDLLYRRLLEDPRGHAADQQDAEAHFKKALALLPHHPRGCFLQSELRIDAGDQRSALNQLQAAIRFFPRVTSLYSGLTYAARTTGLLNLAQLALERRHSLCPANFSYFPGENAYLYLGNRQRFEESLLELKGNPRNGLIHFYKGYMAMMASDRSAAKGAFLAATRCEGTSSQFQELSRIFAELADGKDVEALQALNRLEKARASLRVPDGEFTFKMGEAYALLGQRDAALDTLSRAFAQGFGCTRWYKESPFLGSLRQMPRWQALILHLQERQQLFERGFPPSEFGL